MPNFFNRKKSNSINKDFFDNEHIKKDLKGRSVRGGAVTIATQGAKFILRMGSTVVLARLLTPEDYGLFGMATIFIGFAQLFKDAGLSSATIQKDEINHKQVSTLFWINMAASLAGALIIASLSSLVASFYDEPRLVGIILALAVNFLLSGLAIQHSALLKRQMQFYVLAKIQVGSMVVSIIAGIISAFYGASYWSLIVMQSAFNLTLVFWTWAVCPWFPGAPVLGSGVKSMLSYGGNLTAFNTLNYFSRNFDNIIIGRYWGSQELGLYSKAYQLVLLPIQQINSPLTSVAMPALSRLQDDPEKYRRYYYKAILSIATLGMPIVCFMFATADSLILLVLGEKWLEVVPIFKFLMPAALMGTFNVATGWVYQSLGRTDRQFRWGIFGSTLNVIIFLVSVRWGAIGVAAAYGISRVVIMFPRISYCYQNTPLKLQDLLLTLSRPASASIGAAIALMTINNYLPVNINVSVMFLGNTLLYFLLYLAVWMIIPNGRDTLLEIVKTVKDAKKKK